MTCKICRENHAPDRGLSWDGRGVDSCDVYRSRIATFAQSAPPELGPVMAAAPELLEALRACLKALDVALERAEGDIFGAHHNDAMDAILAAERAIAKAEAGTAKPLTPDELERVGKVLHGARWKSALARDLGVTYQTVLAYATGARPIPQAVALAVRSLAA